MNTLPITALAAATFAAAALRGTEETGPPPVRILCVGDSITQGGKRDRDEWTYRLPLQRKLWENGVAYDFVGSQAGGLDGGVIWPEVAPGVAFDPDHDGYYGNKTADVVRKVRAAWEGRSDVPDIVLVHLGTNDQDAKDHAAAVQAPLRELIAFLRGLNPRVAVFLGHLNFHGSEAANAIRPLVEALAAEMDTAESPVRTVPHYRGWNEKPGSEESDTFDWAHPNPRGQEKMAMAWWAAIAPLLGR